MILIRIITLTLLRFRFLPNLFMSNSRRNSCLSRISFPFDVNDRSILNILVLRAINEVRHFTFIDYCIMMSKVTLISTNGVLNSRIRTLNNTRQVNRIYLGHVLHSTYLTLQRRIIRLRDHRVASVIMRHVVINIEEINTRGVTRSRVIHTLLIRRSLVVRASIRKNITRVLLRLVTMFRSFTMSSTYRLHREIAHGLLIRNNRADHNASITRQVRFMTRTSITRKRQLLRVQVLVMIRHTSVFLSSIRKSNNSVRTLVVMRSINAMNGLTLLATSRNKSTLHLIANDDASITVVTVTRVTTSTIRNLLIRCSVRRTSHAFDVVLNSQVNSCLGILSRNDQRYLRGLQ